MNKFFESCNNLNNFGIWLWLQISQKWVILNSNYKMTKQVIRKPQIKIDIENLDLPIKALKIQKSGFKTFQDIGRHPAVNSLPW